METPTKSTVLGTLIGGAVGDAMGAPFEGLWSESIPSVEELLASFHEYHGYPSGQYTDDTQLTLATIESIVDNNDIVVFDVASRISELWRHQSVIGPGGACTQAAERFLATGSFENMGAPEGQAGNGTAMRTAAVGLWFGDDLPTLIDTITSISRLTHQDKRSVAGGVAVARAANLLSSNQHFSTDEFCRLLADSCIAIDQELGELLRIIPEKMGKESALDFIANAGQQVPEFENPIISPFVIPTVLASVYSVLLYPNSWTDAVTFAVRLGGDVDTLGAIVGALAGARCGVESIPSKLVSDLRDSREIQILAARYHAAIVNHRGSGTE